MAELHVTTWASQHVFHVVHDQRSHGRRKVSRATSGGDAHSVWDGCNEARHKLHERTSSLGNDYRSKGDANRVRNAIDSHTSYIGSGYLDINRAARNPDLAQERALKDIAGMDDFISYAGVRNTEPITVYRGLSAGSVSNSLKSSSPGSVFVEDGFMSTSTSAQVASNFGSGGLLLEIRVPSGRRAVVGTDWEQELVYGRGAQLKMVGYDKDRNRAVMEMVSRG